MKKLLFVAAIALFVSFSSQAQGAYVGLKAGVTMMNIKGDDVPSGYKANVGFMGSLSLNSVISDYFWLKHDFIFETRSYEADFGGGTLKENYMAVEIHPISLTFHIEGAQVFVGPQIGVLISRKATYNGQDVSGSDPLDGYNLFEAGIVAGLEYEFPFGLNIGGRFTKSFVSQFETIDPDPKVEIYNQGFIFSMGYTFGRNK